MGKIHGLSMVNAYANAAVLRKSKTLSQLFATGRAGNEIEEISIKPRKIRLIIELKKSQRVRV
ncbi:hypothetical protein DY000_02016343 [Brassica cretica]|uniref:Uncharacterized protein n=1 Tax=Brassica cretica TaxID=69181 RepID=A0ABQ7CLZ0_BRACR|nr:hypothetical protein DY000_02016343 [Brassica cretica]